jgi:hypothetical protein
MKNTSIDQTGSFVAAIIFAVALVFQTMFRIKAWPIDYLGVIPGFIGDMLALVFWIGAAPLAISFLFLIAVKPIKVAAICAAGFTLVICLMNPLSNFAFAIQNSGQGLQIKTIALNVLSLLAFSIVLFVTLVVIPKLVIHQFTGGR